MPASAAKHPRHPLLLIFAVSAALLLPGLGRTTINREQELRVALTARSMCEGGSWLIPHYRGEVRLRKPPVMYWLVATSMHIARNTQSLLAARLPSALATFGMAAALYALGRFLIGRRRALLAGLMLPATAIILRQGRVAETDVLLTACTATSALFGFLALTRAPSRRWWLLAGLFGGVGFMTKGPAALVLPVLAWAAYAVATPRARSHFRLRHIWPGALAFALVALPWYIAITGFGPNESAAEAQIESEIVVMAAESHHDGPFYYYTYTIFQALAPWSLLLLPAIPAAAMRGRRRAGVRFAALWLLTTFVVLSSISSKQIHYACLLAPPSLLLCAWWLGRRNELLSQRLVGILLAAMILAGLAVAVAPVWITEWPAMAAAMAGAAATWAAAYGLAGLRRLEHRMAAFLVALACLVGLYSASLDDVYEDHSVLPRVLHRSETLLRSAPRVFSGGDHGSILDFYTPRPIRHMADPAAVLRVAKPEDLLILATSRHHPLPPEWQDRPALDSETQHDIGIHIYRLGASDFP